MATRRQPRRAFPLVPLLLSLMAAAAYGRLISDGSPSAPLVSVIRLASPAAAAALSRRHGRAMPPFDICSGLPPCVLVRWTRLQSPRSSQVENM